MAYAPPPNHIGRIVKGGNKILDEIHIYQRGSKTKLIYLQKIKLSSEREELRLGYFIIGKKPAMRGRWVWGGAPLFCLLAI
jgi:hypothetical protein